ncbi:unnamed protein product [Owenia fusiformis]|uniref:Uncharacterized protein n=1 Tax=Owenia fusiformis TaxID=6347 RepID=A0A8S4NJC4_OWEFU|nr:unnamed protein product [Owenia fusiformis]
MSHIIRRQKNVWKNEQSLVQLIKDGKKDGSGMKLDVLEHLSGPTDNGEVTKLLTEIDGRPSHYIKAVFTSDAMEEFSQDQESQPDWDSARIILKNFELNHRPLANQNQVEFFLTVKAFTVWALQENHRRSTSTFDCMENKDVKSKAVEVWAKWKAEQQEESTCGTEPSISDLLAEMAAQSQDDLAPAENLLDREVSGLTNIGLSSVSAPTIDNIFTKQDIFISAQDQNTLKAIEVWHGDSPPEGDLSVENIAQQNDSQHNQDSFVASVQGILTPTLKSSAEKLKKQSSKSHSEISGVEKPLNSKVSDTRPVHKQTIMCQVGDSLNNDLELGLQGQCNVSTEIGESLMGSQYNRDRLQELNNKRNTDHKNQHTSNITSKCAAKNQNQNKVIPGPSSSCDSHSVPNEDLELSCGSIPDTQDSQSQDPHSQDPQSRNPQTGDPESPYANAQSGLIKHCKQGNNDHAEINIASQSTDEYIRLEINDSDLESIGKEKDDHPSVCNQENDTKNLKAPSSINPISSSDHISKPNPQTICENSQENGAKSNSEGNYECKNRVNKSLSPMEMSCSHRDSPNKDVIQSTQIPCGDEECFARPHFQISPIRSSPSECSESSHYHTPTRGSPQQTDTPGHLSTPSLEQPTTPLSSSKRQPSTPISLDSLKCKVKLIGTTSPPPTLTSDFDHRDLFYNDEEMRSVHLRYIDSNRDNSVEEERLKNLLSRSLSPGQAELYMKVLKSPRAQSPRSNTSRTNSPRTLRRSPSNKIKYPDLGNINKDSPESVRLDDLKKPNKRPLETDSLYGSGRSTPSRKRRRLFNKHIQGVLSDSPDEDDDIQAKTKAFKNATALYTAEQLQENNNRERMEELQRKLKEEKRRHELENESALSSDTDGPKIKASPSDALFGRKISRADIKSMEKCASAPELQRTPQRSKKKLFSSQASGVLMPKEDDIPLSIEPPVKHRHQSEAKKTLNKDEQGKLCKKLEGFVRVSKARSISSCSSGSSPRSNSSRSLSTESFERDSEKSRSDISEDISERSFGDSVFDKPAMNSPKIKRRVTINEVPVEIDQVKPSSSKQYNASDDLIVTSSDSSHEKSEISGVDDSNLSNKTDCKTDISIKIKRDISKSDKPIDVKSDANKIDQNTTSIEQTAAESDQKQNKHIETIVISSGEANDLDITPSQINISDGIVHSVSQNRVDDSLSTSGLHGDKTCRPDKDNSHTISDTNNEMVSASKVDTLKTNDINTSHMDSEMVKNKPGKQNSGHVDNDSIPSDEKDNTSQAHRNTTKHQSDNKSSKHQQHSNEKITKTKKISMVTFLSESDDCDNNIISPSSDENTQHSLLKISTRSQSTKDGATGTRMTRSRGNPAINSKSTNTKFQPIKVENKVAKTEISKKSNSKSNRSNKRKKTDNSEETMRNETNEQQQSKAKELDNESDSGCVKRTRRATVKESEAHDAGTTSITSVNTSRRLRNRGKYEEHDNDDQKQSEMSKINTEDVIGDSRKTRSSKCLEIKHNSEKSVSMDHSKQDHRGKKPRTSKSEESFNALQTSSVIEDVSLVNSGNFLYKSTTTPIHSLESYQPQNTEHASKPDKQHSQNSSDSSVNSFNENIRLTRSSRGKSFLTAGNVSEQSRNSPQKNISTDSKEKSSNEQKENSAVTMRSSSSLVDSSGHKIKSRESRNSSPPTPELKTKTKNSSQSRNQLDNSLSDLPKPRKILKKNTQTRGSRTSKDISASDNYETEMGTSSRESRNCTSTRASRNYINDSSESDTEPYSSNILKHNESCKPNTDCVDRISRNNTKTRASRNLLDSSSSEEPNTRKLRKVSKTHTSSTFNKDLVIKESRNPTQTRISRNYSSDSDKELNKRKTRNCSKLQEHYRESKNCTKTRTSNNCKNDSDSDTGSNTRKNQKNSKLQDPSESNNETAFKESRDFTQTRASRNRMENMSDSESNTMSRETVSKLGKPCKSNVDSAIRESIHSTRTRSSKNRIADSSSDSDNEPNTRTTRNISKLQESSRFIKESRNPTETRASRHHKADNRSDLKEMQTQLKSRLTRQQRALLELKFPIQLANKMKKYLSN